MKKILNLKIEAEFGSKFQQDTALDSLTLILRAWNDFYKLNHKKNKIEWTLTEEKTRKLVF